MNTHNIMRLMPEVLAALKATGQNVSLAKDLEAAIEHDRKGREETEEPACVESDGCPTEKAVLQRYWRATQLRRGIVEMGNGDVAVGTCKRSTDGTPGIVYLRLPEPRPHDTDCADVYPVGEAANPEDVLACVYFKSAEVLQQTISVLLDLQEAHYPKAPQPAEPKFDFAAHLQRQREWSERTFGPGHRAAGVIDHIRKELREIEADPNDLREWVDVIILALDGAWRTGASPSQIIEAIVAKQTKNQGRTWPDWRTADPNKAIEHDRGQDAVPEPSGPTGLAAPTPPNKQDPS